MQRITTILKRMGWVGFVVVFWGIPYLSFSQSMDTLWTKIYPTEYGSGCVKLHDLGNAILMIGSQATVEHFGVLLRWVSYDGESLDSVFLQIDSYDISLNGALYVSDNEILLWGRIIGTVDSFYVASATVLGDTNWFRLLLPPGISSVQDLKSGCITQTHEIAVIGTTTAFNGQSYMPQFWLTWLDSVGNVLESNAIIVNHDAHMGEAITTTRDGGLLVSGQNDFGSTFIKMNEERDVRWSSFIGHPNFGYSINAIVQDSTGSFYFAGNVEDWNLGGIDFDDDVVIGALSEIGDSLWMKTLHVPDDQFVESMILSRDGNLIIAGGNRHEVPSKDIMYASCSRNGQIREFRIPNSPYVGNFADLIQIADSTYFLGGTGFFSAGPINYNRFLLAHTERDGRIPTPPSLPTLFCPANNDTVDLQVRFDWSESHDPEPFDTITYSLRIVRGNENATFSGLSHDSLNVNLESVFDGDLNGSYSWTVEARSSYPDTSVVAGLWSFIVLTTATQDIFPEVPQSLQIVSVYPSPFNSTTKFTFDIPRTARTSLKVYDVLGREVQTLLDEVVQSGTRTLLWNPAGITSGIYFVRLQSGDVALTTKVALVK